MPQLNNTSPYIYYIGKIHKNYTEYVNKTLKEYNVNFGDIPYLYYLLEHDNITQEKLAKTLKYNQATVTRAIRRLEKKGFIQRKQDLHDKRKKIIHLTNNGLKITKEAIKKQQQVEQEIIEQFTEDETKITLNTLKKFLEKIEEK